MKFRFFFALFFLIPVLTMHGEGLFQGFDKAAFYSVMASGNMQEIDAEISIVQGAILKEKEGYEGALMMRKAGLLTRPKEKLAVFKSGYLKLESALAKDSSNGEYHFLRLTIQEHAPRVVKYYKDQENDRQHVYRSFKSLSPIVQQAILDYSKHSKILRVKELNG